MAQTPRCPLDGGPYKPPLGVCAIYSQSTIGQSCFVSICTSADTLTTSPLRCARASDPRIVASQTWWMKGTCPASRSSWMTQHSAMPRPANVRFGETQELGERKGRGGNCVSSVAMGPVASCTQITQIDLNSGIYSLSLMRKACPVVS